MNDPFIPWWLVLLLGMWAVALALWVHPNVHREVRLWSGLSTLIYLALIFFALPAQPAPHELPMVTHSALSRAADLGFAVCLAASLAASVYCSGRVSLKCRRVGYLIHILANACICLFLHQPEVAFGLLIVFGVVLRPLIRNVSIPNSTSVHRWLISALQFGDGPVSSGKQGENWLVGGLVSILAFTFFGSIFYSLRSEISRVASSPRYSALPIRERLNEILVSQNRHDRTASLVDLAFGSRSDLLVLMTVLVFLLLAMSMARDFGASTSYSATEEVTPKNGLE